MRLQAMLQMVGLVGAPCGNTKAPRRKYYLCTVLLKGRVSACVHSVLRIDAMASEYPRLLKTPFVRP